MARQVKSSELIKQRYSCRSYRDERLLEAHKTEIRALCGRLTTGLKGENTWFDLVEKDPRETVGDKLGDHGFYTNAHNFIIGKITRSPMAYESFGFRMEQIVLKATALNLGTCWFGYFNPRYFPEIRLGDNEIFPAVVVVGYPRLKPTVRERLIQLAAGARRRKNWQELFFQTRIGYPLEPGFVGDYRLPLELVRLAPSSGNTQPWRVIKERERATFHFFKKSVKPAYEQRRLHDIDLGIALYHFETGVREKGLSGHWETVTPSPSIELAGAAYIISWFGDH